MKSLIKKFLGKVARGRESGVFDERRYWEGRYASSGNSGDGSYGRLADFKARVLNDVIITHQIETAFELGCGDGNQLCMIHYPRYVGLDISPSAVDLCRRKFIGDPTKTFDLYEPRSFHAQAPRFVSDLSVSLDVIYHIVSDSAFESYMRSLCDSATKCVAIYSTNADRRENLHIRHREFTRWIAGNRPDLVLESVIENSHPGEGVQESNAAFFIYARSGSPPGGING